MLRSTMFARRLYGSRPSQSTSVVKDYYVTCSSNKKGFHQRRPYSISAALDEDDDNTNNELQKNLRPTQIVEELNKYVVGQADAKRAVAIALRNRWRRRQLPEDLRKEIVPRNVLLVGPTGKGIFVHSFCSCNDCLYITHPKPHKQTTFNSVKIIRMWENRSGQENGNAE